MLSRVGRLAVALSVSSLCGSLLSGCGDFFSKNSSGGGGGSTTVGSYLYVGSQTGMLASYSVSTTGSLTLLGNAAQVTSSPINAMTITPGNGVLYLAGTTAGIYGLAINASTGGTTLLSTDPLVQDVLPLAMTVDPSGQFLLAAGLYNGGAAVGEYQINSDGTLTEIQGSPVPINLPSGADATNLAVNAIAVAPNSSYIFVSLGQLGVAPLPFSTSGAISTNTKIISALTTTAGGVTVANQDLGLAVNAASTYLFEGETNSGVRVLNIGANSAFTEVSGSPFAAGGQPRSMTLDGTGSSLYVANATDNTISGYSIGSTGALTALTGSPFSSVGSQPYALTLDQSKKFLIAANLGGNPDLQLFSFDATTTGKLDPGATAVNAQSVSLAVTH